MLNMESLHSEAHNLIFLMDHLNRAGHEAHLVGGAVRDAILGRPVKDLDISTSAQPRIVMKTFTDMGLTVHPTGIDHGTVTVMVKGEPFEVTTWRRDVATDGRRAVIAFAETLLEDAQRRDLTVNALYADRQGNVIDPTGQGLSDLADNRLRFVGEAATRIQEDALRILRFFRFHATLNIELCGNDDFEACVAHAELLRDLSKERIGWEMIKLLSGSGAGPVLESMMAAGLSDYVLPKCGVRSDQVASIIDRLDSACGQLGIERTGLMTIATLLDETPKDAYRLSRMDAKSLDSLIAARRCPMGAAEAGYRLGQDLGTAALACIYARSGIDVELDPAILADGAQQVFPLRAKDLPSTVTGKQIGLELKRLEREWIASGFQLSVEDLPSDGMEP